jgi:IS30 family transposase
MHTHLTQEQRNQVSLLLRLNYSQRATAVVLGVSPSTICRELQRNSRAGGDYHAASARVLKQARRAAANSLRKKLLRYPKLAAVVTRKLTEDLSPEQVVG